MRYICFILFFWTTVLQAQKVTVGKEINVRSDFAYEIIGDIKDNIILYRDKGSRHYAEIFDQEMAFKLSREIIFEENKVKIIGTVKNDTSWTLFYTVRKKDEDLLRSRTLNHNGDLIDSTLITPMARKYSQGNTLMVKSENQSKVAFFNIDKDKINVFLVDAEIDTFPIIYAKSILLPEYKVKTDFRKILVTDYGMVCIFLEDEIRDKEKHHIAIVQVREDDNHGLSRVYYDGVYSTDIEVKFDNYNRRLNIIGLYNNDQSKHSLGYYLLSKKISELKPEESFQQTAFGLDFIAKVYGKQIGKAKELEDFSIEDVIIRRDGGLILFAEMNKKYYRRSAFGGVGRRSSIAGQGWTDYYNEDVVVQAIHPDGSEHWRTVLYKKQFSQDDSGIYSSYFLFKTPSRLKILYNDEIKKDNTVSEYILDPLGQTNRNAVLSTEYQKLKLRFRDAVQISSTEVIVPSERNLNLSMVKIDFGE